MCRFNLILGAECDNSHLVFHHKSHDFCSIKRKIQQNIDGSDYQNEHAIVDRASLKLEIFSLAMRANIFK